MSVLLRTLASRMAPHQRGFATARPLAEPIRTVGVVGSGQMGTGIGLVAARNAGLAVRFYDQNAAQLTKSSQFIDKLLAKDISKGKLDETSAQTIKSRISSSDDLGTLGDCEVVIEAATENTDLKLRLFSQLSSLTRPDTILATNTSSISITKIAAATAHPENVIGMHFMNPVPVM
ncbi:hypothetical protein H4R33_007176, partial [Dimargaris cristalligena]